MFENILVCLDGSRLSEAILPPVLAIAGRFNSKVVLLHVIVAPGILEGLGKTELEPADSIPLTGPEEKVDDYLENIAET